MMSNNPPADGPQGSSQPHTIAVIGGTGPQGRGLAYRFALAGHDVVIGSRSAERARDQADTIRQRAVQTRPDARVSGDENAAAASRADIVLLAVPWDGHAALVNGLAEQLAGTIVISCVNPLGFDKDGPYGLVLEESAAQEAQRLVPGARVVGSFHHVAALSLWKTPAALEHEDVLVATDDEEAGRLVAALAVAVTGHAGIVVGGLRLARQLEPLTAVLIGMNKRYKTRTGIAITGIAH